MVDEAQDNIKIMKEINLFLDKNQQWVTNIQLRDILIQLGADQCDILYIHSAISFGCPNMELRKSEILSAMLDVIKSLGVKTICMPTFTFSFCNGKDYDPTTSASKMGLLNEYFRKQEGVIRSLDPLMSVAVLGEDKDLAIGIGHSSCGANSTFDKLYHRDNVKFLFLGAKIGDCMTFMHYLEWLYSVDYRYDRTFVGNVTANGVTTRQEYDLFCRYNSVIPNSNSYVYEQQMYNQSLAKIARCGDGTISIVEAKAAAAAYKDCLEKDPYYFVDFDGKFIKDKSFILKSEMVAM